MSNLVDLSNIGEQNIIKFKTYIANYEILKSRGVMDYETRQNFNNYFTDALLCFPGYTCEMEKQNGRTF